MALKDYTKEFSTNLKIAVPIMLGQAAHIFTGIADNVMVGELGAAQLAAVSLGNTFIFIALAIGIGFSFSITPLVAEADSAGNVEKVKSVFHNGVFLCVVLGSLLTLLLFVSEPLLYYLDQPKEVVELAIPYMRWVSLSLFPLMIFQGFKQFSDGLSKTVYAMGASIAANVLNVGFNYLLIYGKLGFPRLEVEGAAIGTFVSRILMLFLIFFLLFNKVELRKYFVNIKKLSRSTLSKLLNLGLPTSLQMLFEVSLFTAAIFLSGILGKESQAANQIALSLSSLTFMVGVGLGVTATIRVGNQLGLRKPKELKRITRSIFILTLLSTFLFAITFIWFNRELPALYISEPAVIDLAASLLLVAGVFQLSDGMQVVLLGALRGLQDVWLPMLICFFSYWMVGFPISYYLSVHTEYGNSF